MSRNGFQLLLRCFHLVVNSIPSAHRLYKVTPIPNHFNNIMRENYVADKNICIHESMMLSEDDCFSANKKKRNMVSSSMKYVILVIKIKIYSRKS